MDEREQRKGASPVLFRRCVCVCDGVQLCTHQHQTCTHRSVDGNIKYKKKYKNTKEKKKGENAAAPADDVRVRALIAKIDSRLLVYHNIWRSIDGRSWAIISPHQPTPPKRTGKPKCGRHREPLYLCTVPTNKFLCDPHTKKNLEKPDEFFSPEVPHTRKGTSLEYECVMVNSEDIVPYDKTVGRASSSLSSPQEEKEGNRWAL